jgi:hypothetical protein
MSSSKSNIPRYTRILVKVVEDGSAKTFIYRVLEDAPSNSKDQTDKISEYLDSIRKKFSASKDRCD